MVPEISSQTDRQRDRHTDRHTSQYFATTPTGKVKNLLKSVLTFDNLGVFLKGTETSGYATWFRAGGAIRIDHNSKTIRDREKRRPHRPIKSSELSNGENCMALRQLLQNRK